MYLDDATLPAAPVPAQHALLDWRQLATRRRQQLLDAARDLDPYIQAGIDRFVTRRPDVVDFARFRASHRDAADAGAPAALVERSHLLAQYLADRQLAAVEGDGRAALALDLPIGSHVAGYETWAHGDLFAAGMTVGAPPDEFFADGQDWGFPPQLPFAGRRDGHSLWRRLVAHAGEHASVLRIDHVMGVHRLWWVPEGMGATEGAYVRYPRDELLAVIAAEATRTSTTVVGENLGTVPDELSEALARWDVVGMYEEQFSLYHPDRLPDDPGPIGRRRAHPRHAGVRCRLRRRRDRRRPTTTAICSPTTSATPSATPRPTCSTPRSSGSRPATPTSSSPTSTTCSGETAPHNVPGRVLESTWRRRLPRPASAVLRDTDVRRRVKLLANRACGRFPVTTSEAIRQPRRGARPAPLQRGHPSPPARLPRRPPRRHRHVVRGVGAERGERRRARRLRRLARATDCEVIGGSAASGRRTSPAPLAGQSYRYAITTPPRRADGEVRPRRRGGQRAAVDGVDHRRPRPRVGRRRVDGDARRARRGPTRRSRSTSCTSARGDASPRRADASRRTTRWPTRSPTTSSPTASPTSSCCRSWSTRSTARGATRRPATSPRRRATARRSS